MSHDARISCHVVIVKEFDIVGWVFSGFKGWGLKAKNYGYLYVEVENDENFLFLPLYNMASKVVLEIPNLYHEIDVVWIKHKSKNTGMFLPGFQGQGSVATVRVEVEYVMNL